MTQIITNTTDFLTRDSSRLADTEFYCQECGRVHKIPIKKMEVGFDLIKEVPSLIADHLGQSSGKISVIYDRAIDPLIQVQVIEPLLASHLDLSLLPVGSPGVVIDSEVNLSNDAANRMDKGTRLVIGAGSGVVCDITKWVATHRGIPSLIFATAPSMNAYSSITATMTENDIKTSRLLDPASVVLMDANLQATAPMEMIHAGLGDLAARAVCNADWKLSNILRSTYFCPVPYWMTAANEKDIFNASPEIKQRCPTALASLSEAILKSGLSMTVLDGETSPSSGAEHVISHFWDLLTHVRDLPKNLHGMQVGIGTVIMLAFYETMKEVNIGAVNPLALLRSRPTLESIEQENVLLYGSAAPLINAVVRKKYIQDQDYLNHVRSIQSQWEKIWEAVTPYLASLEYVAAPLRATGMTLTLASVKRTPAEAVEALVKGPQYRSRYTILDLAWELGILRDISDEALQRSGVLG